MFASSTQWLQPSIRFAVLLLVTIACGLLGSGVAIGQTQSNAADLQGVVRDPSGAVVSGATVTARNQQVDHDQRRRRLPDCEPYAW